MVIRWKGIALPAVRYAGTRTVSVRFSFHQSPVPIIAIVEPGVTQVQVHFGACGPCKSAPTDFVGKTC